MRNTNCKYRIFLIVVLFYFNVQAIDAKNGELPQPAKVTIAASAYEICQGQSTTLTITYHGANSCTGFILDNGTKPQKIYSMSGSSSTITLYPRSPGVTYKVIGYYEVILSLTYYHLDPGGYTSVYVEVDPSPAANAGVNQYMAPGLGENVIIGAPPVSGNTYSWTSSPSGFTSSASSASVAPTATTTYTLTETTSLGCSTSNSVTIAVLGAPNTADCLGAIPICNLTFVQETVPENNGDIPDFTSGLFCTSIGEQPGNWYKITIKQGGDLAFNIIPFNYSDDYNFAVFNATCSQIYAGTATPISYNYCNTSGITGLRKGSIQTQACSCPSTVLGVSPYPLYNEVIAAATGQTYYLFISTPNSSTKEGYTIDFRNSGATITNNSTLTLSGATISSGCPSTGASSFNTMTLQYSNPVLISSVSTSNFSITDPNGYSYIISSVVPSPSTSAYYSSTFLLTFSSTGLSNTDGGAASPDGLSLYTTGFIRDGCGNIALPQSMPVTVLNPAPIILSITNGDPCIMNIMNIQANTSASPSHYYWYRDGQLIQTTTSNNITVSLPGNYSVGCLLQNPVNTANQCLFISTPLIVN